jgi:hypothetical protein
MLGCQPFQVLLSGADTLLVMGIRNLLSRLPLLSRDVVLTYAVVLGAIYALPIYAVMRSGMPHDVVGWIGISLWAWVGRWFANGLVLGGFNGPADADD